MLEFFTLRMDDIVHSFVRGLSVKVESFWRKRRETTAMLCQLAGNQQMSGDTTFRIKQTAKYVLLQHYLDTCDTKNIQLFIEQQTNFHGNFINTGAVSFMDTHLRRINKKIVQKSKSHNMQHVMHAKNNVTKADKNTNSITGKLNLTNCQHGLVGANAKKNILYNVNKYSKCMCSGDSNINKLILPEGHTSQDRNKDTLQSDDKATDNRINLSSVIVEYAQKEIEMTKDYMKLCIRDNNFMKRNISITLFISVQELHKNIYQMTELSYDLIHVLCKRAILCLIEPSERGFVAFEENLPTVIQNYLLDGYTYHFTSPSNTVGCASALLVLSHWAKLLVKHTDTILMKTICSILHCNSSGIIVLCASDESLADT